MNPREGEKKSDKNIYLHCISLATVNQFKFSLLHPSCLVFGGGACPVTRNSVVHPKLRQSGPALSFLNESS